MLDQATEVLYDCDPVTNFIGSAIHLEICKSLRKEEFLQASIIKSY